MTLVCADERAVLASGESVVIDGANGVTRAPRLEFTEAKWSLGIGALVIVAALATRRFSQQRIALAAVAVAAAVPGAIHVLALRADAPLHRPALASTIERTLGELRTAAPWPTPVNVVRENDDVLFPLGRYAVPTRARFGVELELQGASLAASCTHVGQRVVCQGPKAAPP